MLFVLNANKYFIVIFIHKSNHGDPEGSVQPSDFLQVLETSTRGLSFYCYVNRSPSLSLTSSQMYLRTDLAASEGSISIGERVCCFGILDFSMLE